MCLRLTREHTEQLRADRDITVWKVLALDRDWPGYSSPYQTSKGPEWEPGETYSTELQREPVRPLSFRAYSPYVGTAIAPETFEYREVFGVDFGFHSMAREARAFKLATELELNTRMNANFKRHPNRRDYVVRRMTIPKGSWYYYDPERDEFASSALRFEVDQSDQRVKPQIRGRQAGVVVLDDNIA